MDRISDDSPDSTSEPTPGDSGRAIERESARVLDRVTNRRFQDWYHDRQFRQNILEGQEYFNGPPAEKPPERHTPSKLLVCHRKAAYSRQNAPREGTPPRGLFWVGSTLEERIIVHFLQDTVTTAETYVANSLWVDIELTEDGKDLHVRGSTDPAIVDPDMNPLLVTEVKSTSSLDHLDGPKEHHRAQLHAYLYALNDEHVHAIRGAVIYVSRKTLEIEVFPVHFDREFWGEVVGWMTSQRDYEASGELPPAAPEREWECSYCSYRHRCGKADTPYRDIGTTGFLPLFADYDRQHVREYLDGHEGARLTPTLAHEYPGLVGDYEVYDWTCPSCATSCAWDAIDWDGDTNDPPFCPNCLRNDDLVTLSGPEPSDQHHP